LQSGLRETQEKLRRNARNVYFTTALICISTHKNPRNQRATVYAKLTAERSLGKDSTKLERSPTEG